MGILEEYAEYNQEERWVSVYQKIQAECLAKHKMPFKDAKEPEFRQRNRYRDVSPYDHSRVLLSKNDINYINANFVEYPEANRKYILAQGPLAITAGHFWLMVWEQNSKAIIMLNRIIENRQVKCHQYYPTGSVNNGDDELIFDDVGLKVTYIQDDDLGYYVVRTLVIEDMETGEQKDVLQFHYTTWPDFGVPESPKAFLDFLFDVRSSGVLSSDVGPVVIHCSAGIGRSGTFALVDVCLVLIEQFQSLDGIDIIKVLMELRRSRMGLIQAPEQLRFSYQAIIEGTQRVLHSNSNHEEGLFHTPAVEVRNGGSALQKDVRDGEEETETSIRRRNRQDRTKNTSTQLKQMYEKLGKQHTARRNKWHLKPYFVGACILGLIGSIYFYRSYFGLRFLG